ncbi:RNA-binding RNA processing protein rpp1 [Naganishia albida]|nr:RNA-binding RNA processing protein rpp1 [Naganishia albida]
MYCDLYLPFPTSSPGAGPSTSTSTKKGKGKAAAAPVQQTVNRTCWDDLPQKEKEDADKTFAIAGHLGYTLVANSIPLTRSTAVPPNPFANKVPHPQLDPRYSETTAGSRRLVQLSRLTITLDDSSQHGLNATNTAALSAYDIIAVVPTTANAFSNACLKLTEPGPNQVSIISLPVHQNPRMPFFAKRSLVKTALRNGAVFEIPYAQALGTSDPSISRRYRQNFLTNAREVIRVVMAVSGGGGRDGMRSPADLVNLAVMLGMPSNQAKDAIAYTPRAVILKAQARRTHKGVTAVPRMVPGQVENVNAEDATKKEQSNEEKGSKRRQADGDNGVQDGGQIKRKKVKGDLK